MQACSLSSRRGRDALSPGSLPEVLGIGELMAGSYFKTHVVGRLAVGSGGQGSCSRVRLRAGESAASAWCPQYLGSAPIMSKGGSGGTAGLCRLGRGRATETIRKRVPRRLHELTDDDCGGGRADTGLGRSRSEREKEWRVGTSVPSPRRKCRRPLRILDVPLATNCSAAAAAFATWKVARPACNEATESCAAPMRAACSASLRAALSRRLSARPPSTTRPSSAMSATQSSITNGVTAPLSGSGELTAPRRFQAARALSRRDSS